MLAFLHQELEMTRSVGCAMAWDAGAVAKELEDSAQCDKLLACWDDALKALV